MTPTKWVAQASEMKTDRGGEKERSPGCVGAISNGLDEHRRGECKEKRRVGECKGYEKERKRKNREACRLARTIAKNIVAEAGCRRSGGR